MGRGDHCFEMHQLTGIRDHNRRFPQETITLLPGTVDSMYSGEPLPPPHAFVTVMPGALPICGECDRPLEAFFQEATGLTHGKPIGAGYMPLEHAEGQLTHHLGLEHGIHPTVVEDGQYMPFGAVWEPVQRFNYYTGEFLGSE